MTKWCALRSAVNSILKAASSSLGIAGKGCTFDVATITRQSCTVKFFRETHSIAHSHRDGCLVGCELDVRWSRSRHDEQQAERVGVEREGAQVQ